MRKLMAGGMLALALGCGAREPVGPIAEPPRPTPPPPLVHRVEWRGQTLEQIAGWYTGEKTNWEKLTEPVNAELQRCCVPIRVGREVLIPGALVVTIEPMPKPKGKKRAKAPKAVPKPKAAPEATPAKATAAPQAKATPAKAEVAKNAPAEDEAADDEPVADATEALAARRERAIGIEPLKPGAGTASRKVERGGEALPAGGGEIGEAVLANFAAIHKGDYEKAKALSHPEKRKLMDENESESKEAFELMRAIAPTDVKILGGQVRGNVAVLDFEGKADGEPIKGTIDVQRFEGQWYMESVNTTQ